MREISQDMISAFIENYGPADGTLPVDRRAVRGGLAAALDAMSEAGTEEVEAVLLAEIHRADFIVAVFRLAAESDLPLVDLAETLEELTSRVAALAKEVEQ